MLSCRFTAMTKSSKPVRYIPRNFSRRSLRVKQLLHLLSEPPQSCKSFVLQAIESVPQSERDNPHKLVAALKARGHKAYIARLKDHDPHRTFVYLHWQPNKSSKDQPLECCLWRQPNSHSWYFICAVLSKIVERAKKIDKDSHIQCLLELPIRIIESCFPNPKP